MSVKLRLMRMGKTKQPTYRLVAADERKARNGRFIEIIGTYQPRHEPSSIAIDNDRAVHWLRHGAQPTETARKVLEISGAWAEYKGEPFTPKEPPAPKVVVQTPPKEPEPAAAPVGEAPPDEAAELSDAPGSHAADETGVPEMPSADAEAPVAEAEAEAAPEVAEEPAAEAAPDAAEAEEQA